MKATQPLWRYRLAVTSRALVAGAGGYALAAASAAVLTLTLAGSLSRVEAVMTATLLSWLVYACAIAWAFYARTTWRAGLGVLLPALALAAGAYGWQWLGASA
ncbi:DUF3649 domain-containing protein [Comamonas sp. GB3 AK4-5]|uniref:DUF3649 domain-containing protein n=1 Tax=Comamonas sp. GB3 AK4-5 TaxID=3231487 RepID=UPI00351F3645